MTQEAYTAESMKDTSDSALALLDEQLERLVAAIDRHGRAIDPILRQDMPQDSEDPNRPMPMPMSSLHGQVGRLSHAIGRLDELTNRLAL